MAEGGEGEDEIQFLRTVSKDASVGSVCVCVCGVHLRQSQLAPFEAAERSVRLPQPQMQVILSSLRGRLINARRSSTCRGRRAAAPGDRTPVWGMLMWLQVRGKKKWLCHTSPVYPPPFRSFSLLQMHRRHHHSLLAS